MIGATFRTLSISISTASTGLPYFSSMSLTHDLGRKMAKPFPILQIFLFIGISFSLFRLYNV